MSKNENFVFVSKCDGVAMLKMVQGKILSHLSSKKQTNISLAVLGLCLPELSSTLVEFYVKLFRKFFLHRNERETVMCEADQLLALQLILAAQNKKLYGDFDVEASKVFDVRHKVIEKKLGLTNRQEDEEFLNIFNQYEEFLRECNMVDWLDVHRRVMEESATCKELLDCFNCSDFLFVNIRNCIIEKHLLSHLTKDKHVAEVSVSLPLNESFSQRDISHSAEFIITDCTSTDDYLNQSSSTFDHNFSATEAYAERIFLSYLELLVNSRNELALAAVINIPDRGLDHAAFTVVKHEAKKRNLSMFQTILSFVTRIRLGGKGYAPNTGCSLSLHSKGLSEFTDLMNKLQTVVEEDVNIESATKRLINIIKNCVLRCTTNSYLRRQSIETVAEMLLKECLEIAVVLTSSSDVTPTRSISEGGSLAGRKTLRVVRSLLDHHSSMPLLCSGVDILTDTYTSQSTPVRLPSMISKFRSPTEECIDAAQPVSLAERIKAKIPAKPKAVAPSRQRSCLDWASEADKRQLSPTIVDYIPCKTIVHPGPARRILESSNDKENRTSKISEKKKDDSVSVLSKHPHINSGSSNGANQNIENNLNNSDENSVSTCSKRQRANSNINEKSKRSKVQNTKATSNVPASKANSKAKVCLPLAKGQTQLSSFFRI